MKLIKLTGRETAVLRAVENLGSTGAEIYDRTQIAVADLADILGALSASGYMESYRPGSAFASMEPIEPEQVLASRFEVNPSYAQELKKALQRY